jgi:hypothetical protein
VLVVNSGSTSLKLHLVAADGSAELVAVLEDVDPDTVDAVAHRVVHGGDRFREPVIVDAGVRDGVAALEPLAPLHNASALAGFALGDRFLPGVPQVAVFDTAFHATMAPEATAYALPERWRTEWGVRRYGFHGLSVEWSAERAPALLGRPGDDLRLVVCHLGGGCSVTAVRDGRSRDTTMGFSPLEGVPMASRAGSVDPAALIYALREHGLGVDRLDRELHGESGLKGLGGPATCSSWSAGRARETSGRGWRSTSSPTGSPGQSPRWRSRREASTRSCSRPGSARTRRPFATGCVGAWPSSASSSTRAGTPMPRPTATSPPTAPRYGCSSSARARSLSQPGLPAACSTAPRTGRWAGKPVGGALPGGR